MIKVLNIGCGGKHPKEEELNYCYDYNKELKCENIKHEDFNKTEELPYKDNTFEEVFCIHFIEHITETRKLIEEMRRVLKPRGKLTIIAPHANSINIWSNIEHKRGFVLESFKEGEYTMKGWRIKSKKYHSESNRKESIISAWISNRFGKWSEILFPWMNRYTDIKVVMEKI